MGYINFLYSNIYCSAKVYKLTHTLFFMGSREKGQVLIDTWDIAIFDMIKKNDKISIGDTRRKTGLTHANLIPHLQRLEDIGLIKRERNQQTVELSVDKALKNHFPFLERIKINSLKSKIKRMQNARK
jgi:predicted transcriptional regulator